MEIRDYNGEGRWSSSAVMERYREYCQRFAVMNPRNLSPKTRIEGNVKWIFPIIDEVIIGIEEGDRACTEIGIEFVEEDQRFPFGRILKSNTARALRRAELTTAQVETLRKRITTMLVLG